MVTIRTASPKLVIHADMSATDTGEISVQYRKTTRIGKFSSYFPTRQEARQHLIDHCTKQLEELTDRVKRAEAELKKALSL